ncbi:Crp/Fnr family transcriptional regulator [Nostocoides sp. F2B08]|uniref:Crp/Fnr family transcriptional regulator n=1 Tax=Nostocoides sp. F2B08 TaxID=2653936 RepID=UPI00186ADA4B|nr:cyclic nucleotide-binding domain-containing protein [Tetrasphaera sp. F2B08]
MWSPHLIVDRVAILRRTGLFATTPARVLAGVASRLEEVPFTAGEVLITAGAVEEWLLVLVEGEVEIVRPDGRVRVGPVDTIGELSVLDPAPRIADVVATTDGWALKLVKDDFDEALRLRPEIAAGIVTALARRLRDMRQR